MEQTDGLFINHCRNGRQYNILELPYFRVEVYCPETNKIYELFGCFWRGIKSVTFRNVSTMSVDTLAERFELTVSRFEQITRAGCQVNFQCECEFDNAGIVDHKPEQLPHPIVRPSQF